MSNGKNGHSISRAAWLKRWDDFDALPREVKAAAWDAMDRWDTKDITNTMRRAGNGGASRAAVNALLAWDSHTLAERKPWLRKGEVRVGQRREDMPPSPHRRAEATVLRSHLGEYEHLITPRGGMGLR